MEAIAESLYLIQVRAGSEWIFSTPVDLKFCEPLGKAIRSVNVLKALEGENEVFECRLVEMACDEEGELKPLNYFSPESVTPNK